MHDFLTLFFNLLARQSVPLQGKGHTFISPLKKENSISNFWIPFPWTKHVLYHKLYNRTWALRPSSIEEKILFDNPSNSHPRSVSERVNHAAV